MSGKSSKIEELYSSLTRQDKEGITSFLSCNLFNQSEIVVAIHLYLCDSLIHEPELDKQALYRAVFNAKEKYSDVKLRVFMTKLVKLIEKYLIIKQLDKHPLAELSILTNHYSQFHLQKNHSIYFGLKQVIQFDSYEEFLLYEYNYAVRKLNYIYTEFSNDKEKKQEQFEAVMKSQKKLNLFQTLNIHCELLSFTQKIKSDIESSSDSLQISEILRPNEEYDKTMLAYILVYQIVKDNNLDAFFKLKEMLISKEVSFESNCKTLLSHIENFCVRCINSGKTEFSQHLFEIYECEMLYFKEVGDLKATAFRNIVYTALQLKQLEWAENFVEKYSIKLVVSEQQNNYNFNYARIYFEKKEFKLAMRQLLKVTYEHSVYASMGRILLIKCYYELNDEMPLISCCVSLTQFLNRSKEFTKQRVENNLHFIKYVKILQKHRLDNDLNYFKKLYQKVKESTVVEKEWLLAKIVELF